MALQTRFRQGGAAAAVAVSRVRWQAQTPRVVLAVLCLVLSTLGLRTLLVPPASPPPAHVSANAEDVAANAFAEAFARSYLAWDARRPEAHERALRPFLARDLDTQAGVLLPGTGRQRVRWTAVEGTRAVDSDRLIVTVVAGTNRGPMHLAVSVSRDARGLLFVSALPALLGPPATATDAMAGGETEVEDRQLRAVASRVIRNFLAGDRADLAADLHPRAVTSLPELRARVRTTEAITWVARPRRVAVQVAAEVPHGPRMALRYELDVVRASGRWAVRIVHTNPIAREGDR